MEAINKITPCPGLSSLGLQPMTAHPAAMAAAQLIIMNGLDMDEMAKAMTIWAKMMEEESSEDE